ncbi:MAG: hypothetical protein H6Q72_3303 [Firmicutes bacterium]|nr:hypothetical protein [Bacillota bacterium]
MNHGQLQKQAGEVLPMNSGAVYSSDFYKNQMNGSLASANSIVPLLIEYVNPKSVVDVGCGVGTWLSVFEKCGVEILGLDGEYVNKNLLCIAADCFVPTNLEQVIACDQVFDLAISLEVAEHLSESRAPSFIQELTSLSPVVVFSAAIPKQGGVNHINEKWQSYWVNLFGQYRYLPIDCIRPRVWNCSDIKFWYRQNIILFCDKTKLIDYPKLLQVFRYTQEYQCYDLVHPELFSSLGAR